MDEFEQFEGGVAVHLPDGNTKTLPHPKDSPTQPSEEPSQHSTPRTYATVIFHLLTTFTSCGRNCRRKIISGILGTLEFREALHHRGIQWDAKDGSSMEQQTVLLKLSDPFDRRGLASKLKDLGVPMPRFQAWLKQPLYNELYNQHTKANYEEALPAIRQRLIGNAEAGDQRAIELVFAMTGEWNPQQQHLEDARTIVLKVVEAIIKHVKDVKTREAILSDVSLYAGTLSSMNQQKTLET